MSFVGEPYEIDIFISYSHGDPKGTGKANFRQWSRAFWKELENEFEAHEDLEGLKIFFDGKDRPGEGIDPLLSLDPMLQEKASRSAILLTLISPFYVRSDYCKREREWWHVGQEKHGFDKRGRIAPAMIWGVPPTQYKAWPEAMTEVGLDQLGVVFYDRARAEARPQPFGWPAAGDQIRDQNFFEALQEMIMHLRTHLKEFREVVAQRAADQDPPRRPRGERSKIYLHGRNDSNGEWDRAFRKLSDAGFPVFPDEPEALEVDITHRLNIQRQRVELMCTCDAVLMLAPDDQIKFSQELAVLIKTDRERAISLSRKQLPAGVVDTVRDPVRADRRRSQTTNQSLGWFSSEDPAWVDKVAEWLDR